MIVFLISCVSLCGPVNVNVRVTLCNCVSLLALCMAACILYP